MKGINKLEWKQDEHFHIKKLHIERNNDTEISVLKDNPSSANLFITRKLETIYNGEPQPLKVSQPTNVYFPLSRVYLYYFSAEITLWNKPKKLFPVTIKR